MKLWQASCTKGGSFEMKKVNYADDGIGQVEEKGGHLIDHTLDLGM